MKHTFYSNGKLLLTGEYAVLDGGLALALPTKFGQSLTVEPETDAAINWKSVDANGLTWFEERIEFQEIEHKSLSQNPVKNQLINILHTAFCLNPEAMGNLDGMSITTNLTFPRNWGLGTSSTLLNNIAQWLQIDPFELLKHSFGGSGYDIACAQHDAPILFKRTEGEALVSKAGFNPAFRANLYFVYLNQKQNSRSAIKAYYAKQHDIGNLISKIDTITLAVLNAPDISTFRVELEKHEQLLSKVLEMPTVKESLFPDFPGTLKSLGAWGGDFILAASETNPAAYFLKHGFETLIPYSDIIL